MGEGNQEDSALASEMASTLAHPQEAIRLICLDLDGTLLDSKFQLRPVVHDALHRADRTGISIAIATGRNLHSTLPIVEALGLEMPLITSSGAHIRTVDGRTEEVGLPPSEAKEIIDLALGAGCALFLDRSGLSWAIGNEKLFARHAVLTTDIFTLDVEKAMRVPPLKLSLINEREVIAELRTVVSRRYPDLHLASPYETVLDVSHPDATKGMGLRALAAMLDIRLSCVAAVGDSENDISIFRESALSIAMGNAAEPVRAAADWVAPSNDEGGVAWAVNRIIASEFRPQDPRH